jgi:hypothetical protein
MSSLKKFQLELNCEEEEEMVEDYVTSLLWQYHIFILAPTRISLAWSKYKMKAVTDISIFSSNFHIEIIYYFFNC